MPRLCSSPRGLELPCLCLTSLISSLLCLRCPLRSMPCHCYPVQNNAIAILVNGKQIRCHTQLKFAIAMLSHQSFAFAFPRHSMPLLCLAPLRHSMPLPFCAPRSMRFSAVAIHRYASLFHRPSKQIKTILCLPMPSPCVANIPKLCPGTSKLSQAVGWLIKSLPSLSPTSQYYTVAAHC